MASSLDPEPGKSARVGLLGAVVPDSDGLSSRSFVVGVVVAARGRGRCGMAMRAMSLPSLCATREEAEYLLPRLGDSMAPASHTHTQVARAKVRTDGAGGGQCSKSRDGRGEPGRRKLGRACLLAGLSRQRPGLRVRGDTKTSDRSRSATAEQAPKAKTNWPESRNRNKSRRMVMETGWLGRDGN